MWTEGLAPDRLAGFLYNYEQALEGFGKGSESGARKQHIREGSHSGDADDASRTRSHNGRPRKSKRYFASQARLSGVTKFVW